MAGKARHRQPIIDAAVRLFRQQGYAATGLNELVVASGSPKGSMYHYFPEGKPSIATAAVEEAGRRVVETLEELAVKCPTTGALLRAHAALLAGWMEKSGFRDGCPMTTVLLELTPANVAVTEAGRRAFAARQEVLATKLRADGISAAEADRLAMLCTNALQGSLVLARVERSRKPIEQTAEVLAELLTTASRSTQDAPSHDFGRESA